MDTTLDGSLAGGYKSKSQIARVLTESWTVEHMYCPVCGWPTIRKFPNNKEVADFYCPNCRNEFEQKSKNGAFGAKIPDGAYDTFIQRTCCNDNPDFFMMSYSLEKMSVETLYFVPKFFFIPELVEKRKPLKENAHRAGWVGCNILFEKIPVQGRIPIIKNGISLAKTDVLNRVSHAQRIKTDDISTRGWLLDILNCVNSIDNNDFTLEMVYRFEKELAIKHPDNHNVRAKIRQQLQLLRNREIITFLGNGHYRKII